MKYVFSPEKYGFEESILFPELKGKIGSNYYVKVVAIGKEANRPVYWYLSCYKLHDDRWSFNSSSYDQNDDNNSKRDIYEGTISTKYFANELLKHLLGTCSNKGVEKYGKERLYQNINSERLEYNQK